MKVRLTRIIGGHRMRTEVIEGDATYPPRVGHCFIMTAPPIDPEYDGRFVSTSEVVAIHGDGGFSTRSGSRYKVELLQEIKIPERDQDPS